jgi:hypothetical protein
MGYELLTDRPPQRRLTSTALLYCSQGINLTAADTVILHDMDFNPENDKQAEVRYYGDGMKDGWFACHHLMIMMMMISR